MSVVRNLVVVLVLSILAVVLAMLPAFFVDGAYPDWAGLLVLLAPFAGAATGGWLVSRGSDRGRRVAWTVGGGLGVGLLGLVVMMAVIAVALDAALDGAGYCC